MFRLPQWMWAGLAFIALILCTGPAPAAQHWHSAGSGCNPQRAGPCGGYDLSRQSAGRKCRGNDSRRIENCSRSR